MSWCVHSPERETLVRGNILPRKIRVYTCNNCVTKQRGKFSTGSRMIRKLNPTFERNIYLEAFRDRDPGTEKGTKSVHRPRTWIINELPLTIDWERERESSSRIFLYTSAVRYNAFTSRITLSTLPHGWVTATLESIIFPRYPGRYPG